MAIPATPSNYYLQTANRQNYVSFDLTATATSYQIQRSLDGVSYSVVSSPTNPEYLDTSVTSGVQYWYKVAATNVDGTSPYTEAQSCVPTETGEMSLGQIRLNAQQRADRVNSDFVTLPEWNSYINQSLFELYDLLITIYGDEYYMAPPAAFYTNGSQSRYTLPNGVATFLNESSATYVARSFYKLLGADLMTSNQNNGAVSIPKFNFAERNKYFYPNTNSTQYGVFNMQYRIMGNEIMFIPMPSGNQLIRLWYIPRMTMLLKDRDVSDSSVSGWIEYVITDAAIKALQKEESDVSVLAAQKLQLIDRITATAQNRDVGLPQTISDVRGSGWGGWESGPGGNRGGW